MFKKMKIIIRKIVMITTVTAKKQKPKLKKNERKQQ